MEGEQKTKLASIVALDLLGWKLYDPKMGLLSSMLHQDPRKEYKFGAELGHGNYGVVHLVTHAQSGRIYACKILRNHASKLQQQHIMAEVETLHRVDSHQNIATLHEVSMAYMPSALIV